MEITDYYDVIFKRRSVKKYDQTPLDEKTLEEISNQIKSLKPLYDNIKTEVKIIPLGQVETKKKQSPHYMAVFSEPKGNYLVNTGYMLQQMDLFLSGNDIGSCWQGSPRPKEDILKNSDMEFIIVMSFGKPKKSKELHREGASEFKRKPLSEISMVKGADKILEAARLAPSAGNSQPWFFTGDENMIHAYGSKPYAVKEHKAPKVQKYNTISIGIAIYHLQVALEHFGKKTEIVSDENAKINAPENYEYVVSLKAE
ncbi:nitroreductase family protein [Methanobacterium sp. MBAC-LM]|uniref:nitroreductase family protein n=1 Tax=Methanobacterium sp. MBAC-LM TaxID=3412034 RepID=UPI003C767BD4